MLTLARASQSFPEVKFTQERLEVKAPQTVACVRGTIYIYLSLQLSLRIDSIGDRLRIRLYKAYYKDGDLNIRMVAYV